MKKMKEYVKKHKILFGILLVILLIYAYSHYTTYTFTAKVDRLVDSVPFVKMELFEIKQELKNLGYSLEESIDEYGEILTINATKDDSYVEITDYGVDRVFMFSYTEDSITPMFEGVKWNDKINDIKSKLGLNILNTRFTSLRGVFSTHVFIDSNSIGTRIPTYRNSCIDLWTDDSNRLNRVRVHITRR